MVGLVGGIGDADPGLGEVARHHGGLSDDFKPARMIGEVECGVVDPRGDEHRSAGSDVWLQIMASLCSSRKVSWP